MTAGASLRLRNIPDVRCNAIQEFRAKANARYTLSYYIRIQGLSLEEVSDPLGAGVGAYIYASGREYSLPRERITADTEWIRQEFTFTTGRQCGRGGNGQVLPGALELAMPGNRLVRPGEDYGESRRVEL